MITIMAMMMIKTMVTIMMMVSFGLMQMMEDDDGRLMRLDE